MKTDFKIGDHVFLSKDTARAWGHDEKWVQRYGNRVYMVTRVGSAETMRSIYMRHSAAAQAYTSGYDDEDRLVSAEGRP